MMNTASENHSEIIKRVEKIEVELAVLDSRSRRLEQDIRELINDVKSTSEIARKTYTLVIVIPAVLATMYTLINIIGVTVGN